jgi:proline dehydrogenase
MNSPRTVASISRFGRLVGTKQAQQQQRFRLNYYYGAASGDQSWMMTPVDSVGGKRYKSTEVASAKASSVVENTTTKNNKALPSAVGDFTDTKIAYANKSNLDLLRGVFVLMTCHEFVVRHADQLLHFSKTFLGNTVTNALVRATFFRHFCAGESEKEALKTMKKLHGYGVGGILDFAAEGDLSSNRSTDDVSMSREYEYESERVCDSHMRNFEECVTVAGKGGFAAVKVTALGDAETIRKISLCVTEINALFSRLEHDSGTKTTLTKHSFEQIYHRHFKGGVEGSNHLFDAIMHSARARFHNDEDSLNDEIDVWEWLSFVTPREFVALSKRMKNPPTHFDWTLEDTNKLDRMIGRLDRIAKKASDLGVKIMIDAEQTYFQPAIDALTLELQRRHNSSAQGPVVLSTYQAYLKDAKERLGFALKAAERERWTFACKVVRGAYLVRERALAAEENRPSPIHDTLEDTAQAYRDCCELVLKNGPKSELVVASHNRESVLEVLKLMDQNGRKIGTVSFAQLYGMADAVSFGLAAGGHPVFKYLPFGPVQEVLPYLVRRAQENSSVTAAANAEMKLIASEIKRRMFG